MKNKIMVIIGVLLYCNLCASQDIDQKGICILDRSVESFDFNTWLSAKSRALSDVIPIKYNKNILYLGYGKDQNIYTRINGTKTDNRISADFYKSSVDGSTFMITKTEKITVIIFSKTELGPFLLGTCEIK